jgi:hypothetical protein
MSIPRNLSILAENVLSTGTLTVDLPSNVTIAGQLILNSSENLASGGAVNVAVTASYFTTTTASTATLAIGTAGQIKTFMMFSSGGNMVITVTNAGWKAGGGSGTITFNAAGDACTLQYVGSKWFVIGNNNCVFDEVAGGSPATLVSVPGALNSTGKAGQLAYNSTSFYVCTATDTWANVIFDNISVMPNTSENLIENINKVVEFSHHNVFDI